MQLLTPTKWRNFQHNLFNGRRASPQLLSICIDHFPFELEHIRAKTISLCAALEQVYDLRYIPFQDIQQFQNRVALNHKSRSYMESSEKEKILAELLEDDAKKRTDEQIALAGRSAEDIFGKAYLQEFYSRT